MSQFRHINITGGEPFVRKDLLEVLRNIHRYPFYCNIDIQTNGIILADNPELFSELNKWGVTGLVINFIRNGRMFHIAKALPFSNAPERISIYDWACVAVLIILAWGLYRIKRNSDDE